MAESSSGQDKTEDPTEKRLSDSRKKGDIARSRELNTVVMLLASIAGLYTFGEGISLQMRELVAMDFTLDRQQAFDKGLIIEALKINTLTAVKILAPFFLVMMVAVFIGPLMMGGWSFSAKALAPKISKLNPTKGFKRMFGVQGLVELIKALLKFVLIGGSAVLLIGGLSDQYLMIGQMPLASGIEKGMNLLALVFVTLSFTLIVVVGIDAPYQKWNHMRKLKMTKQEIKEENKESNGNPELKQRIRSVQMEMSNRRMMQEVPTADVIVVNPTHFSVALRYDSSVGNAPRLVAKGVDHMALKIREIANLNDIPIYEAPPLARALYHHTELNEEIPEELFLAVAQVLAYLFQLKQHAEGNQPTPDKPTELPVPSEFQEND